MLDHLKPKIRNGRVRQKKRSTGEHHFNNGLFLKSGNVQPTFLSLQNTNH